MATGSRDSNNNKNYEKFFRNIFQITKSKMPKISLNYHEHITLVQLTPLSWINEKKLQLTSISTFQLHKI